MKVRYTLRARRDLDAIFDYIEARAPKVAYEVIDLLERRIAGLAEFPRMAPMTDEPDVRQLPIVRYPYRVYYEIVEDEVWILHIRHVRRRPWRRGDLDP
jgi:toxin ParE1/3/4